jgi:hypothetical protein
MKPFHIVDFPHKTTNAVRDLAFIILANLVYFHGLFRFEKFSDTQGTFLYVFSGKIPTFLKHFELFSAVFASLEIELHHTSRKSDCFRFMPLAPPVSTVLNLLALFNLE